MQGATGHKHQVALEDLGSAKLYKNWRGDMWITVEKTVRIVHDEHGPVTLEPGFYKVNRAREYDYMGQYSRPVYD